jgi:hypothetical protein
MRLKQSTIRSGEMVQVTADFRRAERPVIVLDRVNRCARRERDPETLVSEIANFSKDCTIRMR